jgi:uncharacterized protein (TIGR03067 family)
MLARLSLLIFATIPLVHAQPVPGKLAKEVAELQGVWRLVGFDVDGKEALLPERRQIRWVIKNDKVYYGHEELAGLTLDAGAKPRCLDFAMVNSKRVYARLSLLIFANHRCTRIDTDGNVGRCGLSLRHLCRSVSIGGSCSRLAHGLPLFVRG